MLLHSFFDFSALKKVDICFASTVKNESEIDSEISDNIDSILGDIDTSELDEFIDVDFLFEGFQYNSFLDVVKLILAGNFFTDYSSLLDFVKNLLSDNFKSIISTLVVILVVVILSEIFKNFCIDKYDDFKKVVDILFSLFLILIIGLMMKNVSWLISDSTQKIFKFSNLLFPILLSLVLISGSTGTYSVYSSLSVFLLNTGSYVFMYVLLPLSASILIMSLVSVVFKGNQFSKTIDLFKTLFKYVIGAMITIFGLFSAVNLITASVQDGVGLKATKYAIKNYIPFLGGYISEGFDFVQASAVLIKNAFGVCSIFVLFAMVLKPLVIYFVYMIGFKIVSLLASYVGSGKYSDMFDNVSKCMGYFIAVMVGVFLIMFIFIYLIIVSVSVI